MKYKAITSFAHKCEHVESGSEVEIADKQDAALLLGLGRIKPLDESAASPVVETAEAPRAPETADLTPIKRKK